MMTGTHVYERMKHRVAAAALLVTAYPEKTEGHLLLSTRTCLWREGVHALMLGVGAAAQRARPFLLHPLAAAEPALSGQLSCSAWIFSGHARRPHRAGKAHGWRA